MKASIITLQTAQGKDWMILLGRYIIPSLQSYTYLFLLELHANVSAIAVLFFKASHLFLTSILICSII
jgi:hypothetical protein